MKKICVVTGSRAEYGLLRWVIQGILESDKLELQIIACGMHLSPEFGLTVKSIEADGFKIDRRIEMLLSSDTSVGICKSIGLGVIGFSDALFDLKPDLLLVLGDRYEIFAAALAANISLIPIGHLQGGETTEGAFDEALRHGITKMSHLHFVAAEVYRRRVIQLGENPQHVFNVGGLGVDSVMKLKLLNREELEMTLNLKLNKRNLIITFHPVTLDGDVGGDQLDNLLTSLSKLENTSFIFTMPNADTGSRGLFAKIQHFCNSRTNAWVFKSLGQLLYFSCVKHVDGVIGNSSSGLCEVPTFKKGTINIGDRQKGRLKALSVIDCLPNEKSISEAIKQLFSAEFQSQLEKVENPYGVGNASDAILRILEEYPFDGMLKKSFYDLHFT